MEYRAGWVRPGTVMPCLASISPSCDVPIILIIHHQQSLHQPILTITPLRTFHIHLTFRHRINFNVALETYEVRNKRKSKRDLASRPLLRSLPSLQSICDPPRGYSHSPSGAIPSKSPCSVNPIIVANGDGLTTRWDIATLNVLYASFAALGQG